MGSRQHPISVRRRFRAIGLSALAATAVCASVEASSHRRTAQPGYECFVRQGRHFAGMTLDEGGRQLHANWEWSGSSDDRLLWISARHSVEDSTPLIAADGTASIRWSRPLAETEGRTRVRMELTSAPESRHSNLAPFASPYEAGQNSLMTSWPDLATFARGSARLTLVIRDRRRRLLARTELDPRLLAPAETEIAQLLEALNALAADFRARCQHVDDVDPEIILT
jgi:hypothetical protein